MEIKARQENDVLIVDMAGKLDTSTSGTAFDTTIALAKGETKRVILRLGQLEYVSSAGLRVILTLAKFLQSAGGELRICDVPRPVQDVLETSGFNSLIKIYHDETSAMAGWR